MSKEATDMDMRIMRMSLREFKTDKLQNAEEGINTEIHQIEMKGELEVLNRYLENYAKIAVLLENYKELLKEDRERIYEAAGSFQEADRKMFYS